MNAKDTIAAVIKTLNQVEVKGKNNMDQLLGCIIALERVLTEESAEKKEG